MRVTYDDTLRWVAKAMQFMPDDPNFHEDAVVFVDMALKHRCWRKFPDKPLPAWNDPNQPWLRVGKYLRPVEVPSYLTILAHRQERLGNRKEARNYFEDACRYSVLGYAEHRDFQRFLKAHNLGPKPKPLLPPENLCVNRFFRLTCPLEEQADSLRSAANKLERNGDLLKARDAMFDLYLFDPSDDELFWRFKRLEDNPLCKRQLDALLASLRPAAQQIGARFHKFSGSSIVPSAKSIEAGGPINFVKPYDDREHYVVRNR